MSIEARTFDSLVSATSEDLPPAVAATTAASALDKGSARRAGYGRRGWNDVGDPVMG